MIQFLVAFLTGLTTGGLSCLAVQGGLLASSIAQEVEASVQSRPQPARRGRKAAAMPARTLAPARPIVLFLIAKLAAYTILGALLGLLGSLLQLTATTRALLQFAIGIFMLGNALRMLDVHPIFRYFALQPPSAVTRYIRRTAKGRDGDVTPLFLGALTVLIPCGVTQAMMAVAMGTGNALTGAALMFAFILGTSPVFFAVAYLATRLGARLEAGFMRVVAVVVLVLGLISVDSGLTLLGSPYSVGNLVATAKAAPAAEVAPAAPAAATAPAAQPGSGAALANVVGPAVADSGMVTITVKAAGYVPALSHAKPNRPLKLALVTDKTYSCARALVIPSLSIEKLLPATGRVLIDIPAQPAGSKLFYSCSMGMYSGAIAFDG